MCDINGCGSNQSDKPLPKVTALDRRQFSLGLASLPLATVLAYPDLARAAGAMSEDFSIDTPSGHKATGSLAKPKSGKGPAILLIHEWWGLNDQIRAVGHELAEMGYLVLSIDLYDGKYGGTREEAMSLMKGLNPTEATEKLVTAINWLRANGTGKVATMGWCFGGGWSLNASLATPVDATVIYYGRVNKSADDLKSLSSPILGHFGTKDKSINEKMVAGFETSLKEAGKTDYTLHWYDADHAFANPTGSRYDEEDAALAWTRTTSFLKEHLS
ncbi:MAG: dienelactone hydrolase family protein [Methylocystaceae bacterium]|nr:dienelactone hydrolase family protein [Methylocystaceae bacterium]